MKYFLTYQRENTPYAERFDSIHALACFVERHNLYDSMLEVVEGDTVAIPVIVDVIEQLLGKELGNSGSV